MLGYHGKFASLSRKLRATQVKYPPREKPAEITASEMVTTRNGGRFHQRAERSNRSQTIHQVPLG